jgi:hypothetical protein
MLLAKIMHCKVPGILLEDNMGEFFLLRNQHVSHRIKIVMFGGTSYERSKKREKQVEVQFLRSEDN